MSILFGVKLKKLRLAKQVPQRKLAALLEIDTATYCKIEKGGRRAKRNQIATLAEFLDIDEKELLRLWLADKIYEIIADEVDASKILNEVAKKVE